ncbi:hypothetical protein IFM89_022997 [Coptis chinensis]|uniref:Uncharacterized protein n=1 Tax=Coptis chinensis TaxID=261450 RepID=A0A835ICL6_9MAGN|nr:hypothetical protein IFM89_022997 [Coptis chinensis]
MGTRKVYEKKLRSGYLHHDPTINPGLGSSRCPRCLSLLDRDSEIGEWTITSVLHDVTSVVGSGAGAVLSSVHGLNSGLSFVQKHVKGPKWVSFVVGLPSFLLFAAASATFGGYAFPKFVQLSVTSYYTASSASHYAISHLTRSIEESRISSSSFKRSSLSYDIPMTQFIINYNSSLPASQRFILHVLDNTHLFVLPNVGEMIRSAISEFRDQNSYEKPA